MGSMNGHSTQQSNNLCLERIVHESEAFLVNVSEEALEVGFPVPVYLSEPVWHLALGIERFILGLQKIERYIVDLLKELRRQMARRPGSHDSFEFAAPLPTKDQGTLHCFRVRWSMINGQASLVIRLLNEN